MARRSEDQVANVASVVPGMTRTTAEPRPNAYIPEELGAPACLLARRYMVRRTHTEHKTHKQ